VADEHVRDTLAGFLEGEGYATAKAANGEEGLLRPPAPRRDEATSGRRQLRSPARESVRRSGVDEPSREEAGAQTTEVEVAAEVAEALDDSPERLSRIET